MAQKWYQRTPVQAALVGGVFALVVAVVSGIFDLWSYTPAPETQLPPTSNWENKLMPDTNVAMSLPEVGTKVGPSRHAEPPTLLGLKLDKGDPFHIDFIFSKGDSALEGQAFADEALKLIKYFLTALTLSEDHLWVNLSPYEEDRIISEEFSSTQMGRDFLQQDYLLKQLAATLTYPEDEIGRKYWAAIYAKVREKYGTDGVEVNAFNKVWIVPDQASVALLGNNALVTSSRLAVLTDYDYLGSASRRPHGHASGGKADSGNTELVQISSDVTNSVLIPDLENEVNHGVNFGPVRQAYTALILATWYKSKVRDSLLSQVAEDKMKLVGLSEPDSDFVKKMYERYVESFKKGVFNYIREDYDPATQVVIPRKYFSGGITAEGIRKNLSQSKGRLRLNSLRAATILVHALLFASGGDSLSMTHGPAIDSSPIPSFIETVKDNPGGIDFGRDFTIDESGDGTFEFEPGLINQALNTDSFAPRVLQAIAFSSLGALIETKEH